MFEQIVHALEDFCSTSRLAAALFDKDDNCVKCLGDKGCMPACVQTMQQKIRDTCFHAEPYENGSCIACRLSIQRWWVMFWTLPSPASKLESIACCYVRLLQSILAVHIHAQPGILPSPSLYDRRVQRVIKLLERNLFEPPGLADLADRSCLSETSLSRLFKRETGYSISSYLQRLRVQASLDLLADEHLHITEISMRCGYGDPAYFSRVFKQVMGTSAQEYRKRLISSYSDNSKTLSIYS